MRLATIEVEAFRAIERCRIELGPGLNVLYGPNDLGKSTLADALRAALLVVVGNKAPTEMQRRGSGSTPRVMIELEQEGERLRLQKRFGARGEATLEHITDEGQSVLLERGRGVDGVLRERLSWGLAAPGGKGKARTAASYLVAALLAEQGQVDALLDQGLSADDDPSGKRLITTALNAMAQDPRVARVIERLGEIVDAAFTDKGQARRGADAPLARIRSEVDAQEARVQELEEKRARSREVEAKVRAARSERDARFEDHSANERALEEALARQGAHQERVEAADALQKAEDALLRLAEEDRKIEALRRAITDLAAEVEERERAVLTARRRLESDQEARTELRRRIEERTFRMEEIRVQLDQADVDERRAKDELDRCDALDAQRAALASHVRERDTLAQRLETMREELRVHTTLLETCHERVRELENLRTHRERARAEARLEDLRTRHARWLEMRASARTHREEAARLSDLVASRPTLSPGTFEGLRALEAERAAVLASPPQNSPPSVLPAIAAALAAATAGGLAGALAHGAALSGVLAAAAALAVFFAVRAWQRHKAAGLAERNWSARKADFEARWSRDAEPILRAAGVPTLDALVRWDGDTKQLRERARAAEHAARDLEEQLPLCAVPAERIAEAEGALAAANERSAGVAATRAMHPVDDATYLREVQEARNKLEEAERTRDTLERTVNDLARDQTSIREKIEMESKEISRREEALGAPLEVARANAKALGSKSQHTRAELEESRRTLEAAEAAARGAIDLDAHDRAIAGASSELATSEAAGNDARQRHHQAQGELAAMERRAAETPRIALEAEEATARTELEALGGAPEEDEADLEDSVRAASERRDESALALDDAERKLSEAQGQLQLLGGAVLEEQAHSAIERLERLREQHRDLEETLQAKRLLRDELRRASEERASHLGRTLAKPVSERFLALVRNRYAEVALQSDLRAQHVASAHGDYEVAALSVGTRDQLATLLRLAIARELQTTLLLDDQLVHSDASRMSWFRDELRAAATDGLQILVLTCRPADYLAADELAQQHETMRDVSPSLRCIDLERAFASGAATANG